MDSTARSTDRRRGFSLVELLIVVSIIVVLIAMIGLVFRPFQESLKVTKCQKNLRAIHGILTQYTEANGGWFPMFSNSGRHLYHPMSYADNRLPAVTAWEAMSDVAQLKDMGASPDVFFCPFHPGYGDYEHWQIKSWEEPREGYNSWHGYHYAMVDMGYFTMLNRGGQYGTNAAYWYSDGRLPIRKDAAGEDNLPIVADLLHYRDGGFNGWWHSGGPRADEGLYNSSCNTLFFGGYVILKEWKELDEQDPGPGTSYGGDMFWFWLGLETDE